MYFKFFWLYCETVEIWCKYKFFMGKNKFLKSSLSKDLSGLASFQKKTSISAKGHAFSSFPKPLLFCSKYLKPSIKSFLGGAF